jgi:hypothetical protein
MAQTRLAAEAEVNQARRIDAAAFASGSQHYEAAVQQSEAAAQRRVEALFINEREELQRAQAAMATQYSIQRGMEARAETQRQELYSETAAAAEARSRLADLPRSPQQWSGAMPFGQAPANIVKQPPFLPPRFVISTPERDQTMDFQSLPSSPLPATVRPLVGSESGAQVSSGY